MAACIFGLGTDFSVHQPLKAAKDTPNRSANLVWVIPSVFLMISNFWRVVIVCLFNYSDDAIISNFIKFVKNRKTYKV